MSKTTSKQVLIVEGKDGFVISNLMMKRKIKPPIGYEERIGDFFINAGSFSQAIDAFDIELDNSDYTNIGLIIDADDKGPQARYQTIKNIIEKRFDVSLPDELSPNGFVFEEKNVPTIGLWVMPNNVSNGYLEHFVAELIEEDSSDIWQFSNQTVDEFKTNSFCDIPEVRTQKARVHAFLALQKKPGLPMGLGISANYIGSKSKSAIIFEEWFKQTFVLTK